MRTNDPQYYDKCIENQHRDWYKCFHDGSVIKPTLEEWTAALASGTKLTLICATCAYSTSTCIGSLHAGRGIKCLCSGVARANDPQYYDRCITNQHRDWYKCFHDGSVIKPTLEEWTAALASGKGSHHTKLTLTCTTCAYSTSTSVISSLRGGRGIRCLCSGKARLNDRQYYDRCIQNQYQDWYKYLHNGFIIKPTWEEWTTALASGKGGNAKLTLTCTTCAYSTNTSSIDTLHNSQGIKCLCSGHAYLNDRQYYDRCIENQYDDKYKCFHDGSLTKPTWEEWTTALSSGKSTVTKLTLTCTTCTYSTSNSDVHSLQGGHGIACLCSGNAPLNDHQYYDRCITNQYQDLYKCFHDGSVIKPTWEEWSTALALGKGSNTKLTLTCTTCAYSTNSQWIVSLRGGRGIACLCSKVARINDRQYYDKCIENQHQDWYKSFHDGSVIKPTWDEWSTALTSGKTSHHTKLTLICATCAYSTSTSSIHSLRGGQGIACRCAMKKGAQTVFTFLETFPGLHWDKETRLYKNPKSCYYCPFDFTNAKHKIIVEADGPQHFHFIPFFHRSQSEFESRVLIDLEKEKWAATNGWLLIRVLSEDALYDQHEWKDYIRSHIDPRVKNSVHNGSIVTPGTSDYVKGPYAITRTKPLNKHLGIEQCPLLLENLGKNPDQSTQLM